MPEVRYWRNETGVTHLVREWSPDAPSPHNATITTECGLEYLVAEPGFEFDPDLSMHQQTTHPDSTGRRCERCPWDEVMG